MKMGNPSLRKSLTRAQSGEMAVETRAATYGGIAAKSIFFGIVTILGAVATVLLLRYAINTENVDLLAPLLIAAGVSFVAMLLFSIIIMFAPATIPVLGTLYSLCQGLLMGLLSALVDLVFPGVAFAAILGTAVVFLVALVCNKFLSAKVTNALLRVMIIGFFSLMLVELGVFVATLFMSAESAIVTHFWVQFAVTAFCVFYAAVMLMWDLQTASELVQTGADKRYEWNVSFSLVTTLVYLYVEILELLVRLAIIFGKNKD